MPNAHKFSYYQQFVVSCFGRGEHKQRRNEKKKPKSKRQSQNKTSGIHLGALHKINFKALPSQVEQIFIARRVAIAFAAAEFNLHARYVAIAVSMAIIFSETIAKSLQSFWQLMSSYSCSQLLKADRRICINYLQESWQRPAQAHRQKVACPV